MRSIFPVLASLACSVCGDNLSEILRQEKQVLTFPESCRLLGTTSKENPRKKLARLFLVRGLEVAFNSHCPHPPPGITNPSRAWKGARARPPVLLLDQQLNAYQWCSNLGQPAALVAGAALASMYELTKELEPAAGDRRRVSFIKKLGKLLFVSAFALEIACVFVTTVTGTMLLGKGVPNPMANHPMEMLHRELEFEYLFSRVSFFQGLLNWLSAVAMHQCVPTKNTTRAALFIKRSTAAAIATMMMYMIAFYNRHMSYYSNYGVMLFRFFYLTFMRYYVDEFRIIPVLALIPLGFACKFAWDSMSDLQNTQSHGESVENTKVHAESVEANIVDGMHLHTCKGCASSKKKLPFLSKKRRPLSHGESVENTKVHGESVEANFDGMHAHTCKECASSKRKPPLRYR